jgi:hypothetical protein
VLHLIVQLEMMWFVDQLNLKLKMSRNGHTTVAMLGMSKSAKDTSTTEVLDNAEEVLLLEP